MRLTTPLAQRHTHHRHIAIEQVADCDANQSAVNHHRETHAKQVPRVTSQTHSQTNTELETNATDGERWKDVCVCECVCNMLQVWSVAIWCDVNFFVLAYAIIPKLLVTSRMFASTLFTFDVCVCFLCVWISATLYFFA